MSEEIDGNKYKGCLCWRFIAGCGCACLEMCDKTQREACTEQQRKDSINENLL